MRWWRAAALVQAGLLATSGPAHAQDAIPSCYAVARLRVTRPAPVRSVFVLVDQTTALDEDLRRTIRSNLQRLIQSGTSFTIATFSAFSRGHHTTVTSTGTLEGPVPVSARPNLPVTRLNALDRCLVRQAHFARGIVDRALMQALGVPATNFANSEIMASLAHLSERIRAARGRRIVIVASDLIEHSSASSFYRSRNLRLIDPALEFRNAQALGLVGDFGRASVFVVGTGMQPAETRNAVRNAREMNALTRYWTLWFQRSNADPITIGRPNIVVPIE